GAATVSAGKGSATGPKGFNHLEYKAAPGETNQVDLDYRRSKKRAIVSDPGVTLTAGAHCKSLDAHSVKCRPYAVHYKSFETAYVDLGDGDDTFEIGAKQPSYFSGTTTFVDGGDGDDDIDGRKAGLDSLMTGGPGSDTVRGNEYVGLADGDGATPATDTYIGSGETSLSYADRTQPLTVNLDTTGGAAGENDTYDDIGEVFGGKADDHLTTSARAGADDNSFYATVHGGPGDDVLTNGSDDVLEVVLDGGKGKDTFECKDGVTDRIDNTEVGELLGPFCDQLQQPAYLFTPLFPSAFTPTTETYRYFCPRYKKGCSGTVALTDPTSGADLGRTDFTIAKGVARGKVDIALTALGQQVAAAQGLANVSISFGRPPATYTINLGVEGGKDFFG
ncbi:MAG: hypothetical protein QOF76_930, partial [Solirubrobacteraceae bacterium]|nr:hypothetical protein [Solirubrobacteraceae bacterium]